MLVCEVFRSVQGEGFLTGTPSVFVRAAGCNLRCWYCDTPYASWTPEGRSLSIEEIVARVEELAEKHVVLTGGEPMIFSALAPLSQRLRELGRHVTVETAGTRYVPVACDLMSISPKLSNSTPSAAEHPHWADRHERARRAPDVIRRLVREYVYQLKFVVDVPADCDEVEGWLAEFPEIDRSRVMLMPQGVEAAELARKAAWLESHCARHGLRFCARKQIEWFGHARGT